MGQGLGCCCSDKFDANPSIRVKDGSRAYSESWAGVATAEYKGAPSAWTSEDEEGAIVNIATILQLHEPCCGPANSTGTDGVMLTPVEGQPRMCGSATRHVVDRNMLQERISEFFESDHVWMINHDDTWQRVMKDEPSCRDWSLTSSSNPSADGSDSLKVAIISAMQESATEGSSEFVLSWTNDDMELNFDFQCFEIRARLVYASERFLEALGSLTHLRLCNGLVSDDKPFHFALVGSIDPQIIACDLYLRVYWFHEFIWQSKELGFCSEPPISRVLTSQDKFGL